MDDDLTGDLLCWVSIKLYGWVGGRARANFSTYITLFKVVNRLELLSTCGHAKGSRDPGM